MDGDQGLLVDVSFCVDGRMGEWVRERLGKVMVVGHLEAVAVRIMNMWCVSCSHTKDRVPHQEELPIPTLPTFSPGPVLNPRLVIRAVLVEQNEDLELSSWYMEIERRRE